MDQFATPSSQIRNCHSIAKQEDEFQNSCLFRTPAFAGLVHSSWSEATKSLGVKLRKQDDEHNHHRVQYILKVRILELMGAIVFHCVVVLIPF